MTAKQEPARRFHALYDKVWREDILAHAYAHSRENGGAPGVDGVTLAQIEHLRRGDLAAAIAVLERDVRLCQAAEILTVYAWATPCLGLAYALSGRGSEARPLLEQAVEYGTKGTGDLAWQTGITGEGYLQAGDLENATRLADRSLRLSRDAHERGYGAWALRLLGDITSRRDPAEAVLAERCYHNALALADELGMRPLAAHCHLGLSTLYRRTGDGERAREHLATATTMYREMHMPFWPEQAKAMMSGSA